MDQLAHDLVYSWRRLWRAPGFTFIAVLTLALGIGANTALFSLVNGLLFKSIPVPNLNRLVTLTTVEAPNGRVLNSVRDEQLRAIGESRPSPFDELALRDPLVGALSGNGNAERVSGELVSGNYFQMLGVLPRAGRLLQPIDDIENGSETPVVISERLWRLWFASDSTAIGRPVKMAGYPLVIVGVVPASFKGTWVPTMLASDVWVPLRAARNVRTVQGTAIPTSHGSLATLAAGVSLIQANAIVEAIGRQTPTPGFSARLAVLPGRSGIMPQEFDHYGLLMGSAVLALSGLVFLIACANLTNLLLARGAARAGEMAIRMAIGASRGRIFQLFLTETVLVTTLAGVTGLALVFATTWLMTTVSLPELGGIVIRFDPSPDFRVFAYALLIAWIATLVVGLVPARHAARAEPWSTLASGGAGSATTRGRRLRTRLVASQLAMSIVLLIGAGLYVRSAVKAVQFDPGYDKSNGTMASVDFTMHKFDEARGRRVLRLMLEAARQIPGVQQAAFASGIPAAGTDGLTPVLPDDRLAGLDEALYAGRATISPGFFQTLGIAIQRGRDFMDSDGPGAPRVVIVSERAASRLWPGQNPIGRRLSAGTDSVWREVIGVAADTATSLRSGVAGAYFYLPAAQNYSPRMSFIVRAPGDPTALIDPLRLALRGVDPDVAVFDVRTVADAVGLLLTPIRVTALVLGSLGVLGFGIAALGVYGVMAFFVSQRTREFGVHKALGASPYQIHAMVLRQGLRMLVRGVVPGIVVALIGAGFLQHVLYGVQPRDPLTFIVIPSALVLAGLAACYLPARRAARVDPSVALRNL